MVRHVFRGQPGRTEEAIATRTRQVLESPDRLQCAFQGWLKPLLGCEVFLDLGCGPGALLVAAAVEGQQGIGIDLSMVWLVVAQRLITERGGRAILAAATAEALPLADNSVSAVVSLDVIEHVADPGAYLRVINRVTGPGGYVALSTPNRYSLTAEPHVGVWGVGWLPRCYQAAYVRWRSNQSYDYCQLLSAGELVRLVRRHTRFQPRVLIPQIPQNEIDAFPPRRARLARMYNRLAGWSCMGGLFRKIGPFFQVVGTKAPQSA